MVISIKFVHPFCQRKLANSILYYQNRPCQGPLRRNTISSFYLIPVIEWLVGCIGKIWRIIEFT